MASSVSPNPTADASSSETDASRPAGYPANSAAQTRHDGAVTRSKAVKPGRLGVTETAFDKPGAASPFGEDVEFPLPVEQLAFARPTMDAEPDTAT